MEKSSTDCYQIPTAFISGSSRKSTSPSDSASIRMTRSTSLSSVSQIITAALICIVCLNTITRPVESALLLKKREISSAEVTSAPDSKTGIKYCLNSTPCGWAVYVPFTRRTDYYMKNTCECEPGKKCQQTDDNLSASAYVYRCRIPTPNNSADQDVNLS